MAEVLGPGELVQLGLESFGREPRLVEAPVDPQLAQAIEELGLEVEAVLSPDEGIDPEIAEAFARFGPGAEFLAFGRRYLDSKGIKGGGPQHFSYGRGRRR